MKRAAILAIAVLALCTLTLSQNKRGPSTVEERERAVRVAEQLEANPLPSDKSDREWIFRWLVEVPDISISVCPGTMTWEKKYKFAGDLMLVQMASSAAFVIKNPGKANDSQAVSLAGFESSLRAYEKLVATDPKARSKQMDEMLAKGADGSLAAFMTEKIKKECK
jgi:hypothetical protein